MGSCFEKSNKELLRSSRLMSSVQKNYQMKWDQIKMQQKEKFEKYENEELKMLILDLDDKVDEDFSYSLQYEQGGRNKEIQVKHYDLIKLNPPNYLNDTLINFYLKLMESELMSNELRNKVYIFNTYFMDKLCPYEKVSLINQGDQTRMNELFCKCYDNIKKWVKEDLFKKEYLLFPLNLPEHWSLIIVVKPGDAVREESNSESSESYIIYLDSFGIIDHRLIQIIKMYLHKYYQERNNLDQAFSESSMAALPAYQPLVPRQVNYIDCGCFLLEYAETFLSSPQKILDNIKDYVNQVKLKWFPRVLVNKKRYFIKRLIIGLKNYNKDDVINQYKQERADLIAAFRDNDDEYDQIDDAQFNDFLAMKNVKDLTPQQKHAQLLDFYMNPNYNYYHIDLLK